MNQQFKGFQLRRAMFPAAYYAANSVYQGFISLYYTHLGFHSAQLGAISAATAAAALMAQPLWGLLGDRVKRRRRLLGALCILSAASLPIKLAGHGFVLQILAAMLFYAFFCALLPLGDSLLLEDQNGNFGAYRLVGGASFALMSALFGALRGRLGPSGVIWTATSLILLAALASGGLPDVSGKQDRKKLSIFVLLKDSSLVRMLLFMLPLQMTMGYFYTFFAPYFKALPGGSDALLGVGYLISAASEAPYLLLSGRIYRRFGAAKPMCLAALALGLRWTLLGIAPSAWLALISQLLHGGGFIVITVSMAYWISDHVPAELRASGQALLNMISFGVARLVGNLGGGLLARAMGDGNAFFVGAGLCAAALACFAPKAFKKRG